MGTVSCETRSGRNETDPGKMTPPPGLQRHAAFAIVDQKRTENSAPRNAARRGTKRDGRCALRQPQQARRLEAVAAARLPARVRLAGAAEGVGAVVLRPVRLPAALERLLCGALAGPVALFDTLDGDAEA